MRILAGACIGRLIWSCAFCASISAQQSPHWHGHVLDPQNAPVPNALVVAGSGPWKEVRTRSDSDGYFRLDWPPEWDWTVEDYLLAWPTVSEPATDKLAPGRTDRPPLLASKSLTLRLRRGTPVRIRALEKSGDGLLRGVDLRLEGQGRGIFDRGRTDADGEVVLVAPEAGIYEIANSGQGTAMPLPALSQWIQGDEEEVAVALEFQVWPAIQPPDIRGADGSPFGIWRQPMAHAPQVWLWEAPEMVPILTLAGDRGLPPDQPQNLQSRMVRLVENNTGLTEREPLIATALQYAWPPQWKQLSGIDMRPPPLLVRRSAVAQNGESVIAIPDAPKFLQFRLQEDVSSSRPLGRFLTNKLNPTEPWLVETPPSSVTVLFQVVDAAGKPAKGVWIEARMRPVATSSKLRRAAAIRQPLAMQAACGITAQGLTNADGIYAAQLNVPGKLSYSYRPDGWEYPTEALQGRLRDVVEPGDTQKVNIRLTPAITSAHQISGQIIRANGLAAGGDLVTSLVASPVSGGREFRCWPEDEGRFHFRGLPQGEYLLEARSPASSAPVRAHTGQNDLLLRLAPTSVLRLRVIAADNQRPLPHAMVMLRGSNQTSFPQLSASGHADLEVRTDSRLGFYALHPEYAAGFLPVPQTEGEGDLVQLNMELHPGREVRVKFVLANGHPDYGVYKVEWLNAPDQQWFDGDSFFAMEDFRWALSIWPYAPQDREMHLRAWNKNGQLLIEDLKIPKGKERIGLRHVVPRAE